MRKLIVPIAVFLVSLGGSTFFSVSNAKKATEDKKETLFKIAEAWDRCAEEVDALRQLHGTRRSSAC